MIPVEIWYEYHTSFYAVKASLECKKDILPSYNVKQTLTNFHFFPPQLSYGTPFPFVIDFPTLNQFCNHISTCALQSH